jgi:DNA-binding transcriptional ArsR family regulator
MSVAAVSKHLTGLETAGLVARSKEAQWRPCHLQAAPLRAVSLWLGDYARFWEDSMDALDDHLRAMQRRTKAKRAKRAKRAKKTARKRLVATR